MLQQRDLRRAQRHRQVRLYLRGDAEAAHVVYDGMDSDLLRHSDRGYVARVRQRAAQSDIAFKAGVVVVRRVSAGGGLEGHGGVQNEVVRRRSPVDGGGVHVGFEGRARLPQSLGRAIELGVVEVASADHGADFAAGIVEREQCALDSGVLLKR